MRCKHVQRLSTEYLDGDLDPDRSSAIRGHLRTCEGCARALDQESAVRHAAAALEPDLDPPAHLWESIQDNLADAEIRDADRPRWVLALRRVAAAVGPYRAHLALAGGLGVVLLALALKHSHAEVPVAAPLAVLSHAAPSPGDSGDVSVQDVAPPLFASQRGAAAPRTRLEQAMREIRRADRRYTTAIVELQQMADRERQRWSAEKAARFDAAVAHFQKRAHTLEHRLAMRVPDDPAARDPLYSVYRDHIAYLERAVLGDVGRAE